MPLTFSITSGPNIGKTASATTNASGQAVFTYTSNGNPGADVIEAGGTVSKVSFRCTRATISWIGAEPRKCEQSWIYTAGLNDNFLDDPQAPEPAYADLTLQAKVGVHYSNFDQVIPNSQFGHTITFSDLAALLDCANCKLFAATLEIGLMATQGGPANDSIHLEAQGGSFAWGARIASDGTTPGILPAPWSPGRAETLHLNLTTLPVNLPSSILSELSDGRLDVYLQDDTGVDYMILRCSTVCDCTEIHGKKFADFNENGMKDANEDYLEGFTIKLFNEQGGLVNTVNTDVNGEYQFTGLQPGTYIVSEDAFQKVPDPSQPLTLVGWHQTFPATGVHVVTLSPGQVVENVNFGDSPLFCGQHWSQWFPVTEATANSPTIGTSTADLIIGTSGDDEIYGVAGKDCIYGLGGNDTIHGDGKNIVNTGNDTIYGGPGNDKIYGDASHDRLYGGAGNDYLAGDAGDDELYGESGRDKLLGDAGSDDLYGGPDNDFLMGDAASDDLNGQDGDDRLCGNSGADDLDGGPGNDGGAGGSGNNSAPIEIEFALDPQDDCTKSEFHKYPL